MARAERKVNDLLSEDASMSDALKVVLGRADDNGGVVEWDDVKSDLTSGQWGRIIEKGILKSADDNGFTVRNPEEVRAALNGDGETTTAKSTAQSSDEAEETTWSTYDKLAAVGAVAMFAGYSISQVRNVIGSALDVFLGPLDAVLPFYAVVLVLALVTGLYSTLLQSNLMNTDRMSEYQNKAKEMQERRKEAKERGDDEALKRIQEEQMEAMGDQLGMFKEQFRPMVWIMLLTIPAFLWLYWMILEGKVQGNELEVIMPFVGRIGWRDSLLVMPAWIIWYFICSMGFTQVIRKGLNIQTTPTGT